MTKRNFSIPSVADILRGHSAADETEVIEAELARRKSKNVFPLDALPSWLHGLNMYMYTKQDIERSYIGLSVLVAASTAIGSYFRVRNGTQEMPLSIWGVLVGLSSSGKTMAANLYIKPLGLLQRKYEDEYREAVNDAATQDERDKIHRTSIMFGNATFESVIRDILLKNPKGIIKFEDELVSWLMQMNAYKSGDVEKAFWLSAFAPTISGYQMQRANGKVLYIKQEKLFVNVFGGTQPNILPAFFGNKNELFDSGFTFRMLFAMPETMRVIAPDTDGFPESEFAHYCDVITTIYKQLAVTDFTEPQYLTFDKRGKELIAKYRAEMQAEINSTEGDRLAWEFRVKSGAFGKIVEYAQRIAAVLYVLEAANYFTKEEDGVKRELKYIQNTIPSNYMERAITIAKYFYASFLEVSELVMSAKIVPQEVLQFASDYLANGCSVSAMMKKFSKRYTKSYSTYSRMLNNYKEKYPRAFNADNR